MNEYKDKELEIDLIELAHVLWARIWALILATALGIGIAAGYTMLFVKPVYKSTSILYVLTKSTSITSLADLQVGTQLTQDYMVVITSRPVVEKVIDNLGLNTSYGALKSNIAVTNPTNTRFLEITVSDHDAYLAKKITDELANVSSEMMATVMDTEKPNIMDYGQVPSSPSSPNLIKNAMIGGMLGFVVFAAIIIVTYLLNDSIHTSEDIERYLGINTLGSIPLEEGVSKRKTRGHDRTRVRKRRHHKKND